MYTTETIKETLEALQNLERKLQNNEPINKDEKNIILGWTSLAIIEVKKSLAAQTEVVNPEIVETCTPKKK